MHVVSNLLRDRDLITETRCLSTQVSTSSFLTSTAMSYYQFGDDDYADSDDVSPDFCAKYCP